MESVKRYGRIGSMAEALPQLVQAYPEMTVYVLSSDFDRVSAENLALQQRLTVQDQRDDDVKFLLMAIRSRSTDSVVIAWIDTALNPIAEAASHEE
jgi:hypothetical protein